MFKRLAQFVLSFRWPMLLALFLMTLHFGDAMLSLQIDPSQSLFNKKSEEYYKEFSQKFGSDYMIAVAMETPNLFSDDYLEVLKSLTQDISAFPQVERVMSLSNVMDIRHKFLGVKMELALKEVYDEKEEPKDIKTQILENEMYSNNLVSDDGRVANILIYLKPAGNDKESSGHFIKRLHQILDTYSSETVKFYIAGAPIEQYNFIQYIRHDQFVFVPVITLLLVITTWIIYRSFFCVILAMSIVFMTLVWTMGTIVLTGQELNLVTSLLAPVIMIVAVVNSIHLMNLFFEVRVHKDSLNEAVVMTMTQLGAPCFLTHFTTILGFISLTINPVPAIQSFGYFAALGTFFSYIVEVLLTPILLPILPYRRKKDVPSEHFFNRVLVLFLEKFEFKWKWVILFMSVVVFVVSILGVRKLEVDTSLIKQMKPDSPLAIATRFIDENLTGVYVLGFILRKKDGTEITDYQSLKTVEQVKEYLESQAEIVKVNSIITLVKKINQARENSPEGYVIPEKQGKLDSYFKRIKESEDPELWKLITKDFRQARLEARMKAVGTKEGALMEERVREYLDTQLPEEYEYYLTGNVVLLGKMAKGLVYNQMRGFGFAFISILVLITLMFRSIKLGLLAAVPNILPIMAIYGLMGFAKIELSSPTAMISSIVLGMVVDASIHFLHRFRLEFSKRYNYVQSLHHTFRNVGQSLLVSTVILCIGFASSVFASFKPTIYLGVLTSLTILFALICTLVVLPVCIIILRPFGKERLFARPQHNR